MGRSLLIYLLAIVCTHSVWSSSSIESICDNLTSEMKMTIDCSNRNFTNVPKLDVENQWEKKLIVRLDHNNIRSLEDDIFMDQLPEGIFITELSLIDCNISAIDHHAFNRMDKLSKLYLSRNKLNNVRWQKVLKPLKALRFLYMDHNPIKHIQKFSFLYLKNLKELDLTSCEIATIESNAFYNLNNVSFLDLSDNKLSNAVLPEIFNSTMNSLTYLYLNGNPLIHILNNSFRGAENLLELDLSDCAIQKMDDDAFHNLNQILRLFLSHNNLTTIPSKEVFKTLASLNKLSLDHNFIKYIQKDAFKYLERIHKIDLSSCQIKIVEKDAFRKPDGEDYIKNIMLKDNQVSCSQVQKSFNSTISVVDICEEEVINSVVAVKVDNWQRGIVTCTVQFATPLPGIVQFFIDECELFESSEFYIGECELQNSPIARINEAKNENNLSTRAIEIPNYPSLINRRIGCRMKNSISHSKIVYLPSSSVPDWTSPPPNVLCPFPTKFASIYVDDPIAVAVASRSNLTSIPEISIHDEVSNYAVVINLSGNDFPVLKRNIFVQKLSDPRTATTIQELYLHECNVAFIENGSFYGLTNLKLLFLSRNKLSTLPNNEVFPKTLKYLNLAKNAIKYVDGNSFKKMNQLVLLDLHACNITLVEYDAFDSLDIIEHYKSTNDDRVTFSSTFDFGIRLFDNKLESSCRNYDIALSAERFQQFIHLYAYSSDHRIIDDLSHCKPDSPSIKLDQTTDFKYTFECEVETKSGSEIITWYWKNEPVYSPLANSFVTSISPTWEEPINDRMVKYSTLRFPNEGFPCAECEINVQCVVENSAGESKDETRLDKKADSTDLILAFPLNVRPIQPE